jgi:hypothetical protein
MRGPLAAAIVESDGGGEASCVSGLRLLRPDLRILAGIADVARSEHPGAEPGACRA